MEGLWTNIVVLIVTFILVTVSVALYIWIVSRIEKRLSNMIAILDKRAEEDERQEREIKKTEI